MRASKDPEHNDEPDRGSRRVCTLQVPGAQYPCWFYQSILKRLRFDICIFTKWVHPLPSKILSIVRCRCHWLRSCHKYIFFSSVHNILCLPLLDCLMIAFRWICPSAWWPLLIGITKDLTARVGEKKLRSQRNFVKIKCWRQNVSMNKIPLCSSLTTIFSYLLFSSSFEKLDNYNLRKHSFKSRFFPECENTRGPSHAQYSEGSAVPRGTLHMRRWKWYQQ